MIGDNSVLTALALLERVEPQLNIDTRCQIDRNSLVAIQHYILEVLSKIVKKGLKNHLIQTNLIQVDALITEILLDDNFEMTDLNTKELLAEKTLHALNLLYVEAGMYYDTEHEFNYTMRLNALLQRIVDRCISQGYYFGQ